MSDLKQLKKIYDKLNNDRMRSILLRGADVLGVRKGILRMDTNNRCNIRCIMCQKLDSTQKASFLSLENFKEIISKYGKRTRFFYLSCAYEPLLTPNFTEYVRYAKRQKIPFVSFCTNGLLLNKKNIQELVDGGLDEIIISYNGFSKGTYERIMKGSDFEKICGNIKALCDYKRERGLSKPMIRLNTILLQSNIEEIEHILPFLESNDIATIQFRELMVYDNQNDKEEVRKELLTGLSATQYEVYRKRVQDLVEKMLANGREIILPASFLEKAPEQPHMRQPQKSSLPQDSPMTKSILKGQNIPKHSCSIPFFSSWIDAEGNVRICGYDSKGILGNLLKEDFSSLRKKRKTFQKLALSGECSKELCTTNIDSSTIV